MYMCSVCMYGVICLYVWCVYMWYVCCMHVYVMCVSVYYVYMYTVCIYVYCVCMYVCSVHVCVACSPFSLYYLYGVLLLSVLRLWGDSFWVTWVLHSSSDSHPSHKLCQHDCWEGIMFTPPFFLLSLFPPWFSIGVTKYTRQSAKLERLIWLLVSEASVHSWLAFGPPEKEIMMEVPGGGRRASWWKCMVGEMSHLTQESTEMKGSLRSTKPVATPPMTKLALAPKGSTMSQEHHQQDCLSMFEPLRDI